MPSNLCGKNACKTIYSLPLRLQTYRDTQHSIVHPLLLPPVQVPLLILLVLPSLMDLFWHKDLNWVIEMRLSLAFWTHLSCSSSKFEGFWSLAVASITWSKDLTMFFKKATDRIVFITSTGSTPSAGLGKFESPISFCVPKKSHKNFAINLWWKSLLQNLLPNTLLTAQQHT